MTVRNWWQKLFSQPSSDSQRSRRARLRERRRRYAPRVENLEDRTLLSTLAVVGTTLTYAQTSNINHVLTVNGDAGTGIWTFTDNENFTSLPTGWFGWIRVGRRRWPTAG